VSDISVGLLTPDNLTPRVYQLALRTPGIKPWSASFRKQMRQMPNFWYTARGRPQSRQRFSNRELNFGTLFALAIFDLLATIVLGGCRLSAVGCQPDTQTALLFLT
jgi:hypothetical protein